jgi:Fur family ferric uptake transcriptional regulator
VSQPWDELLRASGFRITPQRQLVLEAVHTLKHCTPEEILAEVQKTAAAVNLSTIYRTIDVLEEVGLITHTHIGHGAPSYRPVGQDVEIHLVCDTCSCVQSVSADAASDFIEKLRGLAGFETDATHLSIYGQCAQCQARVDLIT